MNPNVKKRIGSSLLMIIGLLFAFWLIIDAIDEGMHLYQSPTDFLDKSLTKGYIGGLVALESVNEAGDNIGFSIQDEQSVIQVVYRGSLPAMFKEGRETIVFGEMKDGQFVAQQVLAKHDQYYRTEA